MKKLTLLRHAKSGDDGLAARDLDRRLNPKGRRAARAMGRHLRDLGTHFDAILASPAVRVMETVEEAGSGYGHALEPHWDRRLYLAPADEIIDVLHEQPDTVESVLLVGHNPGLEELVLSLVADHDDAGRLAVSEKYPTASLAEIDLAIDGWRDLKPDTGRLVRFVRPRDLDPAFGPEFQ